MEFTSRFWNSRVIWTGSPVIEGRPLAGNDRAAFLYQRMKVPDGIVQGLVATHLHEEIRASGFHPRKIQQVVDQPLHAFRALHDEVDELIRIALKLPLIALCQQLSVDRHRAQRLLQIVTGDVCKLLQLFVGTHQSIGALQYAFFQVRVQLPDLLFGFLPLADVADGAGDHHAFLGLQRAEADLDGERLGVPPGKRSVLCLVHIPSLHIPDGPPAESPSRHQRP